MQLITFFCLVLFFAVLYSRYRNRPKNAPPRTRKQQLKTAKVLFAAFIVWMAVRYSLLHSLAKMDGVDQAPSLMERVVSFFAK
jgi:hypothetical protein